MKFDIIILFIMSTIELASVTNLTTEQYSDQPLVLAANQVESIQQSEARTDDLSKIRSVFIVITVAGISFTNSLGSGLLTVGLPRIAADVQLAEGLLLWPASIYALTSGCTLLLAGAIADVIGNRPVFLTGCGLSTAFTIGIGLSRTGFQLIMFRAFQGIAMSLCLPTAVGLVTTTFPTGRTRNVAFASLGGGQPLGFALGLVLGGLFVDSIGWRYEYYLACIFNGLVLIAAVFTLPVSSTQTRRSERLLHDVDWIGALIASTCLGLLSYVFAYVLSRILLPRANNFIVGSPRII